MSERYNAYIDTDNNILGLQHNVYEQMAEFRRTLDRNVLVDFLQTLAHERRHVTSGNVVQVNPSGLRPGRSPYVADNASYRADEILSVAEEIAIAAMALRGEYVVPRREIERIYRSRNMLRGFVTEEEYQRIRSLIIRELRNRYGEFSPGCDSAITVGVIYAMEYNRWYECAEDRFLYPRGLGGAAPSRLQGLNLCEGPGQNGICQARMRRNP
jgi:hypothetical protein